MTIPGNTPIDETPKTPKDGAGNPASATGNTGPLRPEIHSGGEHGRGKETKKPAISRDLPTNIPAAKGNHTSLDPKRARNNGQKTRSRKEVLQHMVTDWIEKRYPGQTYHGSDASNLGPLLLAIRALGLGERERMTIALTEGMSPMGTELVLADTKIPDEKRRRDRIWRHTRTWARILRADAIRKKRSIPKAWKLPVSEDEVERVWEAAEKSGLPYDKFLRFALTSPYISEAARDMILEMDAQIEAIAASGENIGVLTAKSEEGDEETGNHICGECGDEGVNNFVVDKDIVAEQERDGYTYFPQRLIPWVGHVEDLVRGRHAILTLIYGEAGGEKEESGFESAYETEAGRKQRMGEAGNALVVDIHHGEPGFQWGYEGRVKRQFGALLSRALERSEWATAVLRVFTGEKDEIIGWPVKEVRGWNLHLEDDCDTPAHGIDANDMLVAHETDGASGERTRNPEFGVAFKDGEDIEG